MKELGIEGMTFKFVNSSHSGVITITGLPSTKARKIPENKYIYLDGLTFSIANGSNGSNIINATGSGYMIATLIKNIVENKKPLSKGDQSNQIIMTGTNTSPPPITLTYTTQIEIDNPGQNKILGN